MIHCCKCRRATETNDLKVVKTRNNRMAQSGLCSVCNARKYKFVKSQGSVSGGDILSSVAPFVSKIKFPGQKYPGEMHPFGALFMGPFTRLDLGLNPDGTPKPDSLPINRIDESAYRHDLWYNKFSDTQHRNKADDIMVAEMDAIEDPTPKERMMRAVARPILVGKSKLGLGLKKNFGH